MANIATIKNDLMATRPTFEQMNLNKLNFAKELEFAIQIFEKNDYLTKMTPQSIKNSLVNIALSGLTLNPVLKFAYLVPRAGSCCVDVSYQGMIKIVTDTGSVKSVQAAVVYEKDKFDINLGSNGFVSHKPYLGADTRGRKVGVYSIATLNDGTEHIDFMRWDEIMAIKARSESVKKEKFSPWSSDEDEMAKKTVVKRHFKYLPKSDRAIMAANAIDFDNQANGIDFESEANQQAAASTNEPDGANKAEYALATEEDKDAILSLLNNPLLGDKVFVGKKSKEETKAYVIKEYDENKFPKDLAEKFIKWLNNDINLAKEAAGDPTDGFADETAEPAAADQPVAATEPSTQKDKDFE